MARLLIEACTQEPTDGDLADIVVVVVSVSGADDGKPVTSFGTQVRTPTTVPVDHGQRILELISTGTEPTWESERLLGLTTLPSSSNERVRSPFQGVIRR
jgi:hypothetical protein